MHVGICVYANDMLLVMEVHYSILYDSAFPLGHFCEQWLYTSANDFPWLLFESPFDVCSCAMHIVTPSFSALVVPVIMQMVRHLEHFL